MAGNEKGAGWRRLDVDAYLNAVIIVYVAVNSDLVRERLRPDISRFGTGSSCERG